MNHSEFRLGNYVFNANDEISVIKAINPQQIQGAPLFGAGEVAMITPKPIPVTVELLMQFGFRLGVGSYYEGDQEIYDEEIFGFVKKTKEWRFDYEFQYGKLYDFKALSHIYSCSIKETCKYSHQLQNLCYALSGVELTIENEDSYDLILYSDMRDQL